MIDGACQRADLLLQRAERQRFRQVVDGIADLLQPLRQHGKGGILRLLAGAGVQPRLEGAPAAIEIVEAAVHRTHAILARQGVERCLDLFHFKAERMDTAVVALFGQCLDRARKPLELAAKLFAFPRSGGRLVGARDILAQGLEFVVQTGAHLLAQFFAQAPQLAGDLADRGDAVLLAAHAVDVARYRLVVLLETGSRLRSPTRRLIGALLACRTLGVGLRAGAGMTLAGGVPCPADLFFQRLQRLVELVQRAERPALPACVECVEVGPLGVHRGAVFRNGWLGQLPLNSCRGRSDGPSAGKGRLPAFAPRFENREKIDTG